MSEKICPGCGAKIESTSNICAYCGHDLKLGEEEFILFPPSLRS